MGQKIYKEIWASLPSIDGRMSSLTQKERDDYADLLYRNTKTILFSGVLVPVKESHNTTDELLHGSLLSIKKVFKKLPVPHFVLMAELFLDDEYYEIYRQGKLPGVSIEIAEGADLTAYGKTDKISNYVMAIALLGSTPPAMPNLQEVTGDLQAYQLYTSYVARQVYNIQEYNTEVIKMTREEFVKSFMELLDAFMGEEKSDEKKSEEKKPADETVEVPATVIPMTEMGCSKEANETAKETFSAKDGVITELQNKVVELEKISVEASFKALAAIGKVTVEQKETFSQIAKTQGIAFAEKVYSAMPTITPPIGEVVTAVGGMEKDKRLIQVYKNIGLKDDEIEKIIAEQAKIKK